MTSRRELFWPSDWCHLVFIGGSTILLAIFRDEAPDALAWSAVNLVFLSVVVGAAIATRRRNRATGSLVRMIFAMCVIPVVFTQLGALVPIVNPSGHERRLFEIDRLLCGGHNPLEFIERIAHPWLTEILQWVYDYYFFIPVIVGVCVLKRDRPVVAARLTFCMILCIYLSYLGYYLVPVTGPNIDILGLYSFSGDLEGVWLARELRETMFAVEKIKQDCFPERTYGGVLAVVDTGLAIPSSRRAAAVSARCGTDLLDRVSSVSLLGRRRGRRRTGVDLPLRRPRPSRHSGTAELGTS